MQGQQRSRGRLQSCFLLPPGWCRRSTPAAAADLGDGGHHFGSLPGQPKQIISEWKAESTVMLLCKHAGLA